MHQSWISPHSRSRRLTYAFDLLLAVLSVFSLLHISEKVAIPASFEQKGDTLVVATATPETGLKPGDRFLSLSGKMPTSELHLEYLLDRHRQGTDAVVTIRRHETPISLPVPLEKYYDAGYLVSIAFAGLVFVFFGLLLLIKRPNDRVAIIAHWLSITLAATILFTWGSDDNTLMGLVLKMTFIIAYSIAPAIYLQFSSAFPSPLKGWRGSLHKIFYVTGGIIGATGSVIIILLSRDLIEFSTYKTVSLLSNLNFAAGMLLAVGNYIYAYRFAIEESDRRKIRWIILGNAFSVFSYVFLWLLPKVVGMSPIISEGVVLLLSSVAPVTFTIAIVRYHLFDIDRLINRASVYVIVIGCVLAIYSALVAFIATVVGQSVTGMTSIPSVIASIIIAICFDPLRGAVQKFVDRKFFRVRYDYQSIVRKVNMNLERVYDTDSLRRLIESDLTELFQPEELRVQFGENLISSEDILPNMLGAHRAIVEEGAAATIVNAGKRQLTFCFRLEDERTYGMLQMTAKRSGRRYSLEDIELLNAITSASVLALQRIVVTKELAIKSEEALALRELNELKSLFVSSVTHDLKAPLTSIKMFTEMLDTSYGPADTSAKEYLGIIGGETERLKALIDNILDYSKIEKGIMRYEVGVQDLNALIVDVVAKMRYMLEMQGFQLELELADGALLVPADRSSVESVLTNLIGNAIKYSADERHIHIRSFIENGAAKIIISDRGIGIAPADIQHIFLPFYRGQISGASQASGSGLGLANVKQMMAAHGGDVTVESAVGQGTTFCLAFPRERIYA